MEDTFCIACLSWRRPGILKQTLETYKANGFLKYANEKVVYFNQITNADRLVAQEYDFTIMGSNRNVGIGRAFRTMACNTKSKFILFLENDFSLVESEENTVKQLDVCKKLLNDNISVIRLRHKNRHGKPLYSKDAWKRTGKMLNTHLLNLVHCIDKDFPPEIEEKELDKIRYWYTTAKHANYTNNPTMYDREWFNDKVGPFCQRNSIALEGDIQPWWGKQDFLVAQTEGLFCHGLIQVS